MKYLFITIVLLSALLMVSCDRYIRSAQSIDFNADLFTPLANALNSAGGTNLSQVMSWYSEGYLHNAVNKTQREEFYQSLFTLYGDDISFEPVFINYNAATKSVNWELRVYASGTRNPLTVFTFNDEKIVPRQDKWILYGNQIVDLEQGTRQRVFIESFTFTTCPNCPAVEEVLHSLQAQYPAQFSYLEYHIGDALQAPGNTDILGYYGFTPMPVSIFQGQEKRSGANPETLEAYVAFVNSMLNHDPNLLLGDFEYSFTGQTLNGSVWLNSWGATNIPENMKLKYTLIEKVSAASNSAGAPCTNVVLASGNLDISLSDLNQQISFSLPFNGNLPADTSIVIYAQEQPTPFANNAVIHNGIEIPLSIPTR